MDINNILEWKQQFGEVYMIEVLDQQFFFRPLGREEYKEIIMLDLDLGEFQEAICYQTIIYPEYEFSTGIAGVAEIISDGILDISGLHLGQAKELLDQFRDEMNNYDYQVDCLIHEAFPEHSLEDISTWSIRKTMFYLSRSEWVLRNLKGIPIAPIEETIQQSFESAEQHQEQPLTKQPVKPKKEQPQKSVPEGAIQSEEELLAMLAESGAKISKPLTKHEEVYPELSWFKHHEELTGEFD